MAFLTQSQLTQWSQEEVIRNDSEPIILDYARHYGLTTAFTSDEPLAINRKAAKLLYIASGSPVSSGASETLAIVPEKLTVSDRGRALLRDVFRTPADCGWDLPEPLSRRETVSKLELPLLMTDNELDLVHYGSDTTFILANVQLPSPEACEDRDEGLSWSSEELDKLSRIETELQVVKLKIPSKSLDFLKMIHHTSAAPVANMFDFDIDVPRNHVGLDILLRKLS